MLPTSPLVSVILTSYNKKQTISRAIESVINQTYTNWELFVMDDNSNIETLKVIQQFQKNAKIKFFNSNIHDKDRYKTTRYATLINEAIPKTTGKYITYLTDDNKFLSDRLKTMVNYLEKHPGTEVVYSRQRVKNVDDNGKVIKNITRKTYGVLSQAAGLVDHCSVMHTKRIADKVYNIHGSYWDDDPKYWFNGDAAFWNRLTKLTPFYPIRRVLDIAYKTPDSFQELYKNMPENIPSGTLVKGPSTDIYLIENRMRRRIAPDVFNKLCYQATQVIDIPDPFIFKYKEGNPVDQKVFSSHDLMPNQRLIKSENNTDIYFLQNKKKHLIPNQKVFKDYNFEARQIISLKDSLINKFESGLALKELSMADKLIPDGVFYCYGSDFYLSFKNCLLPINSQTAANLKLPVSNPVRVNGDFVSKFIKRKPDS